MSLSRILNDDPVPAVSSTREYPGPSATIPLDTSPLLANSPRSNGHFSPPNSHAHEFRSTGYPDPTPGTPQYQPEHVNAARLLSPDRNSEPISYAHPEDDPALNRKRRRGGNSELEEHHALTTRRSTLRKQTSRTKHFRPSPRGNSPEPCSNQRQRYTSEEERRRASSDLEDCTDIWREELGAYIDRNAGTARAMSHWYSSRIARIPVPPPTFNEHPVLEDDPQDPYRPNNVELDDDPGSYDTKYHNRDFNDGAADAAHELERSVLGDYNDHDIPYPSKSANGRISGKMGFPDPGDIDLLQQGDKHANKKRKLDNEFSTATPASVLGDRKSQAKVKGKPKVLRDPTPDNPSATPKQSRKKPVPKKQLGELELKPSSNPPSVFGDVTPPVSVSRPPSPVPIIPGIIFELTDEIPPLKKAKKVDEHAMTKRLKTLEESQRKVWTNIARRDIAKVYKYQVSGYQSRQSQVERIAKVASLQARRPYTKTAKATKDVQAKAKRLMREMQVFWKKNEKEERDVRKREQKEASDRLKVEEEKREAARQARKLEFLISQTELYSHFLAETSIATDIEGDGESDESHLAPAAPNLELVDPTTLKEINFDDEDQTNLRRHAMHNAQEAIALAKQRAETFDAQAALERKTNEALKLAKAQAHIHNGLDETEKSDTSNERVPQQKAPIVDLDSDELNFQNPTSLNGPLTIGQPKMLMAQLKEYQLKGLNWLATLYEQGINGILADEMVAPASTLHNWQQEITRFVPGLKALPYWGNVKDRATLRKFWSKKDITYNRDAPFHVLITSYQLVTQDQQYFQRVKWQYMILDEAQNIKNSASVRWKTLLGFQCRNRLLLTGTPIQNSMQELWALLHFIMPSLFDSHDEFNEWFSKDIENAAENKGSKLNEHQLRRLHMILKPFMLRRVKRHVQNELSEKVMFLLVHD
ncbi:hypothetical protein C0993_010747 [Termitomyces sp. T159_Od127]|nr:hypothetical protein C0993_010747 [Termitomyces sp. T159_Od127]